MQESKPKTWEILENNRQIILNDKALLPGEVIDIEGIGDASAR